MVLGQGYYWVELDEEGQYTGHICSAWYGDSDKPMATSVPNGKWVLVKEIQ